MGPVRRQKTVHLFRPTTPPNGSPVVVMSRTLANAGKATPAADRFDVAAHGPAAHVPAGTPGTASLPQMQVAARGAGSGDLVALARRLERGENPLAGWTDKQRAALHSAFTSDELKDQAPDVFVQALRLVEMGFEMTDAAAAVRR